MSCKRKTPWRGKGGAAGATSVECACALRVLIVCLVCVPCVCVGVQRVTLTLWLVRRLSICFWCTMNHTSLQRNLTTSSWFLKRVVTLACLRAMGSCSVSRCCECASVCVCVCVWDVGVA